LQKFRTWRVKFKKSVASVVKNEIKYQVPFTIKGNSARGVEVESHGSYGMCVLRDRKNWIWVDISAETSLH
jgi:hypothetical protein